MTILTLLTWILPGVTRNRISHYVTRILSGYTRILPSCFQDFIRCYQDFTRCYQDFTMLLLGVIMILPSGYQDFFKCYQEFISSYQDFNWHYVLNLNFLAIIKKSKLLFSYILHACTIKRCQKIPSNGPKRETTIPFITLEIDALKAFRVILVGCFEKILHLAYHKTRYTKTGVDAVSTSQSFQSVFNHISLELVRN